ncbi:MAG: undecaprenyl-diphosphate phosphatase [Candidatus Omnitrophica bacterium]|nr:undecaprenyl-diphosphate phosphatase [Candidatus Omnitrophota bacterium]
MLKYITLGIIQGLTEFFPVSSSGHLVIMQRILGVSGEEVALSAFLHLGTVCALLLFFFRDILRIFKEAKTIFLILVVTVITGVIGLAGKNFFESLFSRPRAVAYSLIVTGIILILTRKVKDPKREKVNLKDACLLGLTQAIAIIPGISRSGITISTLLFRKIDREVAFKFSFLASIPAILGANLLEIKKIELSLTPIWLAGFFASLLSGLLALFLLKRILQQAKFHYFGYYCIIVAIITLLFLK